MSREDLCCPNCGAELLVEQIFGHAVDHRAFLHLATISVPLGARVMQYLQLFAPARNRLTMARKAKLIEQLLPDLQRQAINHKGRDWHAPLQAWEIAIDGMLLQRDQGKLQLPLSGHGYLYAVLASMADKVERSGENQREQSRRERHVEGSTGSADLGAVLDELTPELEATQKAIAERNNWPPSRPRVFHSAADVLAANPHLRKGASHEQ